MRMAVVEDWDQFRAFMAAQPLCQWAAKKEREIASGMHQIHHVRTIHPPPRNDNADLAAALSSMA